MKTIFCDIDGTLIKHHNEGLFGQIMNDVVVLPGVKDKLLQWEKGGYTIILTTGRPECLRKHTERQMLDAGIYYQQLVMGLPRGRRVLINDSKVVDEMGISVIMTAEAYTVDRNEGIKEVEE
jgi:hypothetical protein